MLDYDLIDPLPAQSERENAINICNIKNYIKLVANT